MFFIFLVLQSFILRRRIQSYKTKRNKAKQRLWGLVWPSKNYRYRKIRHDRMSKNLIVKLHTAFKKYCKASKSMDKDLLSVWSDHSIIIGNTSITLTVTRYFPNVCVYVCMYTHIYSIDLPNSYGNDIHIIPILEIKQGIKRLSYLFNSQVIYCETSVQNKYAGHTLSILLLMLYITKHSRILSLCIYDTCTHMFSYFMYAHIYMFRFTYICIYM